MIDVVNLISILVEAKMAIEISDFKFRIRYF
jgi:hypothetical protein